MDARTGQVDAMGSDAIKVAFIYQPQRLRPVGHGFDYPTWFLMLPLRALRTQPNPALRRNQRGGW